MSTITSCTNPISYFVKYLKDYKTTNNITNAATFETDVADILSTGITIPDSLNKNLCCPDCPGSCDTGTYVLSSMSVFQNFVTTTKLNDPAPGDPVPCCTNYFSGLTAYTAFRANVLCYLPSCCNMFTSDCVQSLQSFLVETTGTTAVTFQDLLTDGIVEYSTISGNSQLCTLITELKAQLPGEFGYKVYKVISENGLVISCNQCTANATTFSDVTKYLTCV